MKTIIDRIRAIRPADAGRVLAANRQFVVGLVVVLIAVAFFPGEPAPTLLSDTRASAPQQLVGTSPAAPAVGGSDLATPIIGEAAAPIPPPQTIGDRIDSILPPAPEPEPELVCDTDALADVLDQVRDPVGELLGTHVPGAAVRKLAAIATGCSDEDATGPVLDLALEFAALVPDTGLDTIDLPDLPPIPPLNLPDQVTDALGPLADTIRDGCGTLSLLAVIFAVIPAAASLPVGGSDLAQFIAPVSVLCGIFDEDAA